MEEMTNETSGVGVRQILEHKMKFCPSSGRQLRMGFLKHKSFVSYALPTDIFIRHEKNRCSDETHSPMILALMTDYASGGTQRNLIMMDKMKMSLKYICNMYLSFIIH